MKATASITDAVWGICLTAGLASSLELDVNDNNSIMKAASTVADGMVDWYTGGVSGQIVSQIPGLLPGPYYWWEAGAMMGSLIDYWYYTGDSKYNGLVEAGMLFQVGDDVNYEPTNQTKSLGNDDQSFWGFAAMSAAENKFPNPPADEPQWLALAQAVFNSQAMVWDTSSCGGGLRWQKFSFNLGYDYKNSISNGCFFNLAARLGAYTHNKTYMEWATKAYDWSADPAIGLVGEKYLVFDGTGDTENCTSVNHQLWTYNSGVYLLGAAVMWNQTEGADRDLWGTRVQGLLDAAGFYFKDNGIMYEYSCETSGRCDFDQRSFKAYLSRWMAATIKVAPWTHDQILPLLQASASGAALSCSGGDDGTTCGMQWTIGSWDGLSDVGYQMAALEVIQSLLIDTVAGPVGKGSGGISKGDPSGGTTEDNPLEMVRITTGDRAGAGILTAVLLVGLLGGAWWLVA